MFGFKLLLAISIIGKHFVTAPASGNPLLRGNNGRSTNPLLKGPIDYSQSSNPLLRQNPSGGQQVPFVQNIQPGTGVGTDIGNSGSQNSANIAATTTVATGSVGVDTPSSSSGLGDGNSLGTTVAGQPPPPPSDGPPVDPGSTSVLPGSSVNTDDFFQDTVTTPKSMDAPMKSKANLNAIGSNQNVSNGNGVLKPMNKPDKFTNGNVSPDTPVGSNNKAINATNAINGQSVGTKVQSSNLPNNNNNNSQNIGNTNGQTINSVKTPVTLADQGNQGGQTSNNVITQPNPINDGTKPKPIFTNLKGNKTISKLDPIPTHNKGSFKPSGPIVGFPSEGKPPPKNPFAINIDNLPVATNIATASDNFKSERE